MVSLEALEVSFAALVVSLKALEVSFGAFVVSLEALVVSFSFKVSLLPEDLFPFVPPSPSEGKSLFRSEVSIPVLILV